MWAGKNEDPVCITIFSAPNYCGHENPGSIFVTGSPNVKDRVLCYDEYAHQNYMLLDRETGEYPVDPSDAITWFNEAMKEWLSEIFKSILSKINS